MSTRRLAKVPLFGNAAKAVTVEAGATVGAQIGVNLLMPDGSLATTAKLQALFGDGTPSDGSINTTDDLEEGQWNLWFTDRRAQDAVGGILADSANVTLRYTPGAAITADLTDVTLAAGGLLKKRAFDAKGRLVQEAAATTDDLAEGDNLYFTDARADARADARIAVAKADPDGVASLVGGKLDAGQLPALAITETFVVNTEAAMLALSAQEGDVAVRTDLSKSFILTAAPASTLANWQELLVPTAGVTSFNGRTGSVTPASGDYTPAQVGAEPAITAGTATQYWRGDKTWQALDKAAVGLGNVDNTSDANKPVSTPQQAQLDNRLKLDASNAVKTKFFISRDVDDSFISFSGGLGFGGKARFEMAGASFPGANVNCALFYGASIVFLDPIANEYARVNAAGIIPTPDNARSLGLAAERWSVVYAGTGTINTSDAREKTVVAPLTDVELAAAADLSRAIGTYQWLSMVAEKGADNARHHAGLTVQRAIEIMQAHGLDPMRYGFICYDQWDELPEVVSSWPAQDAVLDDAGNVITPAVEAGSEITQEYRPAGDRYSFRHDELLLFIARGFAARLDALETAR